MKRVTILAVLGATCLSVIAAPAVQTGDPSVEISLVGVWLRFDAEGFSDHSQVFTVRADGTAIVQSLGDKIPVRAVAFPYRLDRERQTLVFKGVKFRYQVERKGNHRFLTLTTEADSEGVRATVQRYGLVTDYLWPANNHKRAGCKHE